MSLFPHFDCFYVCGILQQALVQAKHASSEEQDLALALRSSDLEQREVKQPSLQSVLPVFFSFSSYLHH